MLSSFLKRAGIGFLIGIALGNLIAWLTSGGNGNIYNPAFVARIGGAAPAAICQTLLSGLLGAVSMGTMVFYEIERWPLALSTAAHFLAIEAFYVPIALVLGWAATPAELLISVAIQLVVFILIWLVMYLRYKAQVRVLNELLKKRKGGNET